MLETQIEILQLSPERHQAVVDALEHVRFAAVRVAVAERLLTEPQHIIFDADEPDDFTVAYEAINQALGCLAVAHEEIERARFLP